ncbi:unnamed protein product [Acanthoscelides obtectus]|uniref:Uncharacterized protein n=1 Tax=Acanthoscelides obtectus TaxID=200917 RepID=A0A9P0QAN8_ACAOB|nr:unnamed protein product [Acanthoscelides obtectus]CAK1677803.1 hypothetical protein AOBTE_LOCUS31565 [Acanthoscelides obtectus]
MSDRKMMYAFRGWIAFVAFMDLGTAVRSYIEKRSFLSRTINDVQQYIDEEYTTSRILGLYSVLKALALIHCTLYIHYKPSYTGRIGLSPNTFENMGRKCRR